MIKKMFLAIALLAAPSVFDSVLSQFDSSLNLNSIQAQARNDGTYSRTNKSVSIYTQSGHPKGSYAIYLHRGRRYINFKNRWIFIQGKQRFACDGNWYVINIDL